MFCIYGGYDEAEKTRPSRLLSYTIYIFRSFKATHTGTTGMRAFVVKELTHPSNITLSTDVPEPTAGPGQVLVDVYSAGLNFFEVATFFYGVHPNSA